MKKRIKELTKIINNANHEYYILEKPTMSDQQYDEYVRELEKLEEEHPEYIQKNSPLKQINVSLNTPFSKVEHMMPMLSLSNVFSYQQLLEFHQRIKKTIAKPEYVCELKIDGLAVSLIYEDGLLKQGVTRGDGFLGEDITNNVLAIKAIPNHLQKKANITVRGEIFMSKEAFENLNNTRQKNNEALFANPRNAASGSVRQLDANVTASRQLDCYIYQGVNQAENSHYERLKALQKLGLKVNPHFSLMSDIDEIFAFIEKWEQGRKNLAYEIDGVVIKIDNVENQKLLGQTAKSPKWAIAYKFPALEEVTQIKDIIFTVGRTGQVTPNAVLDPVHIDGSLVSRTTLHNEKNVLEKDIRIGDYVFVRKAGDVIPEVVKVVTEKRKTSNKKFKMTDNCPICKKKLQKEASAAAYFCVNEKCEAREQESLVHFVSRNAMNIEGLGEKIIEIFYNESFLKSIKDIYLLKNYRHKIISLIGFGEKRIDNILANIEKSKKNNLDKLLFALGIKHVGAKTAKILAQEIKSLEYFESISYDELININEIGDKIAQSVIAYFQKAETQALIAFFKKEQVNIQYYEKGLQEKQFYDKTFVITGTFENYNRLQIAEILENKGARVTNTVTKKTSVLLCGKNPGSKLNKAKELQIPIWDETDFQNNLNI